MPGLSYLKYRNSTTHAKTSGSLRILSSCLEKTDFEVEITKRAFELALARYKEMGLIEEAIHEFQISSKHPLKYFDSAGLLGICFREKGIYDDAVSWLYKALEAPDRLEEEYLAIKYELVVTFKMKEDFKAALSIVREIVKKNPKFRDVAKIHNELSSRVTPS